MLVVAHLTDILDPVDGFHNPWSRSNKFVHCISDAAAVVGSISATDGIMYG